MDLFPDQAHVRLRSRVHGMYLHADEDGVGVSLTERRDSLNAVWLVHRVQRDGKHDLLLHSASYGRYLALSRDAEHLRFASDGARAVQCRYFNEEDQRDVMWAATRTRDGDIFLRNCKFTYDADGFSAMPWAVEVVPARGCPPLLPAPTQEPMLLRRMVLYIKGDHYGNIDYNSTKVLIFEGRSVSNLRDELAYRLDEQHPVRIAMCLWSGSHGRLTPLVVDLPGNNDTFESWSKAALELRYPNVDA